MSLSSESENVSSPSFKVPPFAKRCYRAAAGIWKQSFSHPFVAQLIDGTLDSDRFRFYQMQDARYLEAYADVCSILSTRMVDPEKKLWFIEGARMAILVERSLHENYGKEFGYSSGDIARMSLSPNNRAYQNHMRAAANQGSLLEALAALAPCPWLYADIGQTVGASGAIKDNHPFCEWLKEYSDPIFVEYTNELLAHLEEAAEGSVDESEKDRAIENFVLSTRYEHMFWQQAWDRQRWPDEEFEDHLASGYQAS